MSARIRSRTARFRVVRGDETQPKRLCSNCVHGYLGADGVLCGALNELINNETVAEECELFEGSA